MLTRFFRYWKDSSFRDVFEIIAMAAVMFFISKFVVQNFSIDGQSMEPNYHHGQRLFVETISKRMDWIQRGDVIVLASPETIPAEGFYDSLSIKERIFLWWYPIEIKLIKRVIGLPGETVRVRDNRVFVTNAEGKEEEVVEPYLQKDANTGMMLPNGQAEWKIPSGYYLVMGDNRSNSQDGRVFGPVKKELIDGRALVVYYPFSDFHFVRHHTYTKTPKTAAALP